MKTKTVQGTQLTPAIILADKALRADMQAAWDKTTNEKIEYGGWIYYKEGTYRTQQKKGDATSVGLTPAPAYKRDSGYEIVGDWHCHPGTDVAASRPSAEDIKNAKAKDYFMFVMTAKAQPKAGWKEELLQQIEIVDDNPAKYRIWNII